MEVVEVEATSAAFAAIRRDGTVVVWGDPDLGADTSLAKSLANVQRIEATAGAFAAIHDDGQVTAWGLKDLGGDASAVQEELLQVRSISASGGAFAAIRANGTVVTWGDPATGPAKWVGPSLLCDTSTLLALSMYILERGNMRGGHVESSQEYGGSSSSIRHHLVDVMEATQAQ